MRKITPPMSEAKDGLTGPSLEPAETIEEIYDRYAPQVERWARRLAGPRVDPEDLLHDIFLIVLRRRHEFRSETKITTWLFRITEQVVRWRLRNEASCARPQDVGRKRRPISIGCFHTRKRRTMAWSTLT